MVLKRCDPTTAGRMRKLRPAAPLQPHSLDVAVWLGPIQHNTLLTGFEFFAKSPICAVESKVLASRYHACLVEERGYDVAVCAGRRACSC